MKKKINEKMGGGARIGLGGTNAAGPHYDYYKTNNPSGYHSGGYTGNADSQISQRHSLISTINEFDVSYDEPEDVFGYDDEDDMYDIGDSNEDLMEFFTNMSMKPIKEQHIMLESKVGDRIQQMITVALMAILDDASGELSGILSAVPILYKNIYEIYRVNNLIDLEYQKPSINKKELNRLKDQLILEMTDIINAVVIALPMTGLDTVGVALITLLQSPVIGSTSNYISIKYNNLIETRPIMGKIFQALSYPLGGRVIIKGIENIDKINRNMYISSTSLNESESLCEFFARMIKMPLTESDKKSLEENHCNIEEGHCKTHESKCTMSEDHCDEAIRIMEEQGIEEISVVGSIAGATTPLGTDSRGNIPSSSRRKSRLAHAKRTFGGN